MFLYLIIWVVLIIWLIYSNMKRSGRLDEMSRKRKENKDENVVYEDNGQNFNRNQDMNQNMNMNQNQNQNWYSQGQPNYGGYQQQQQPRGPQGPTLNGGQVGRVVGIAAVIAIIAVLAMNAWYTVSEEEYAVITTFGSPSVEESAGLHFKIPFIQRVTKVSKAIMGMEIGYTTDPTVAAGASESNPISIESESMMITRDYNIVNVDFYVEYMVTDPIQAVRHQTVYEDIIKSLAQSYIRDTVGVYDVDDVITTGKTEIQETIKEKLTNRLIEEDIGYGIYNVSIQDTELPRSDVAAAFRAVEDAQQGMETNINSALKYQSENIPLANAEADRLIQEAEAYKEERINEATGQAARFEQTYEEYVKYPLITKQRLFYETMEEVLPDLRVIIDDGSSVQEILPLDSFTSPDGSDSSSSSSDDNNTTTGSSNSTTSAATAATSASSASAATADTEVTGGEQ